MSLVWACGRVSGGGASARESGIPARSERAEIEVAF
jgi:hypothetical protein